MADESINEIYEEIRAKLNTLGLKEAKEYFDLENIPDSLSDNTFLIGATDLDAGDMMQPDDRIPIFNIKAKFKIMLSARLPASEIIDKIKRTSVKVESIIKAILSIVCGEDEKDRIRFIEAPTETKQDKLVYEIVFELNYRIKNI